MPTYQYACTACGEQHEAVQSFTDPALTECPQCGGLLRKVYSAVGVVFKGSGFYKTDSRAKADAGTKSDSGSGSGSGSDASSPAAAKKEGSTGSSTPSTSTSSTTTTSTPAAKTA